MIVNMQLTPVDSSHLSGMGYDPETQLLRVQFKDGSTYEYDGVDQQTYDGFKIAPSVGKYFFQNIKSVFDGRRVWGS